MSSVGRPGIGTPVNIRLTDDLLQGVDARATLLSKLEGRKVSRAEAIRRLLEQALYDPT